MSFELKICFLFSLLLAHAAATQTPKERLRDCSEACQQQHPGGDRLRACQERCMDKFGGEEMMSEKKETEEGEKRNLFVFEDRHFFTLVQTQHGRFRILQKFTDLLEGIRNYRVVILEADPQTFVVPNHWDADAVLFVTNGRGTVSFVQLDRRETFNVEQGDVFRIKAGTTTYLINRDNKEKLVLAQLVRPINTPTQFEPFFGAGGENPESFFKAFSDDILEATFNTRKDIFDRVLSRQRQGAIVKASQEQIQAMTQSEEGRIWPFGGGESKETVNLYQQRPTQSNQYGQFYEVDFGRSKELQDLDVGVALANITQGGMTALYYNSRATKVSIVVDGKGYLEMAYPLISQSQEAQGETVAGPTYQKIRTPLKRGTIVVVPAGYPSVSVASEDQGLQIVCFEINSRDNERFPLAGKRNVINQLEKEAKALAFGISAEEVDQVFNSQQDEFFFKGPQKGRAQSLRAGV